VVFAIKFEHSTIHKFCIRTHPFEWLKQRLSALPKKLLLSLLAEDFVSTKFNCCRWLAYHVCCWKFSTAMLMPHLEATGLLWNLLLDCFEIWNLLLDCFEICCWTAVLSASVTVSGLGYKLLLLAWAAVIDFKGCCVD
jgi:hypothetical protein